MSKVKTGCLRMVLILLGLSVMFCFWLYLSVKKEDKDGSSHNSYFVFSDFKGNVFNHDFDVIEVIFSEEKMEEDTIKMNFVFPEWEFRNHVCSFQFPEEYQVQRIERIVEFCPSIFDDEQITGVQFPDDSSAGRQFLKLEDLKQFVYEDLPIIDRGTLIKLKNGSTNSSFKEELRRNQSAWNKLIESKCLFYYPEVEISESVYKKFKSISKTDLNQSIENTVNRQFEANVEYAKAYWKSYLDGYTISKFQCVGKVYSIDVFNVLLKMDLKKDLEIETKYFNFFIQVGN